MGDEGSARPGAKAPSFQAAFIAVGGSLGSVQCRTEPAAIVVGAGLMGRHHAQAAAAAGARIVAVVDPDRGAATALAASWPGAVAETDLGRALESTRSRAQPTSALLCRRMPNSAPWSRMRASTRWSRNRSPRTPMKRGVSTKVCRGTDGWRAPRTNMPSSAASATPRRGCRRPARSGALPSTSALPEPCTGSMPGMKSSPDILPHPLSMVQKLLPSVELAALEWSCVRPAPGEWVITAPIDAPPLSSSSA